ncbi:ABC transporter permease [Kiloniella sp. b19]|uniref:ABC transporter permease n=1 Tax=Kiloniella sp. GXU_MW_B19 TaxID=3141326 RepID=UPI0031CDF15B
MESVSFLEIVGLTLGRFWPVWIALAFILITGLMYQNRLGLYGRLFSSGVGIAGVMILGFWVFTALFADIIVTVDPLAQFPAMKNKLPGTIEPGTGIAFLFGGDNLARDVFSRVVSGSQIVLIIAPAATAFALMVGTVLGLPAGYFGGKTDTIVSFLANLVLAFPVILLFYLLVTPGIMETPIPYAMAGVFFMFPILFFLTLFYTKFKNRSEKLVPYMALTLLLGGWIYIGLVFDADPLGIVAIDPNELNIFVSVVFVTSPAVFRIVRGLVLDIKTRDYIAAAQTRGESPWYIMLWEILPNARGPLIVDACLRIGYTTILLGTLGYFGLGLAPESPDWGTAIKDGSRLLRLYAHPAIFPALALMSFVLGLNMLADSLREESLKD